MKRKINRRNCRPSFRVSEAGHLLKVKGSAKAGSILASDGKTERRKRLKRGCLSGTSTTFSLTAKQKRNLPTAMQKGLIAYHRSLGKKIID